MNITIDDKFKKTLVDQANIYIDLINSQGSGYINYEIYHFKDWSDLESICLLEFTYERLRDYINAVSLITMLDRYNISKEVNTIYSAPPPEFYKTCTSLFRLMRTVVAVTFLTK